jgi:2-keto-4-pentenoate hydratase/2-oxohepta-3-ene-1,7-dioic acid hydratase in catechol pathway
MHSDGTVRDLAGPVPDIGGAVLSDAGSAMLRGIDPATLPVVAAGTRLGPCVAGTGNFICIGLNGSDHAAETGATVPPEPILFMKATCAICGPNDPIIIPRGSEKTDGEAEPAVIIGTRARYVTEPEAPDQVAGHAVPDDVSERAFRTERSGQWTRAESCDHFGPLGPWLVTRDEIPDPQDPAMRLTVSGKTCRNGARRTMVCGPAHLVSDLSQFGTPLGVGPGQTPLPCLKPGDVVEPGIAGLVQQRQDGIGDPQCSRPQ